MVMKGWNNQTNKVPLKRMLTETSTQVKQADLCKGKLCVDSKKFTMWVDASSLATRNWWVHCQGCVLIEGRARHTTY